MRGVTTSLSLESQVYLFQLTRLMRGVTLYGQAATPIQQISTHTPHARRDVNRINFSVDLSISTHTPHARRDLRMLLTRRTQ